MEISEPLGFHERIVDVVLERLGLRMIDQGVVDASIRVGMPVAADFSDGARLLGPVADAPAPLLGLTLGR